MGTSSADPDDLALYVSAGQALNEYSKKRVGALSALYEGYAAQPSDYRVDASSVLADLRGWVDRNSQDDEWVAGVAAAFRAADSTNGIATVDDFAIRASLRMYGVMDSLREGFLALTARVFRDPQTVARWWEALTFAEREALLAEDPKWLGGLNGVPTAWRDRANRLALRQAIERLERERDAAAAEVARELDNPWKIAGSVLAFPGSRTPAQRRLDDVQLRLDGALNLQRQLEAVAKNPGHRLDPRDVYLLEFDVDFADGGGGAAVSLGDPKTADYLAVDVTGTGNTLRNVQNPLENAARLRATLANDQGQSAVQDTAIIMWLGYDTPQGLHDAWNKNEAKGGAPVLRQFVDDLYAAHDGPSRPHVTVSGYSYGSTVVGMAAKQGMCVDDVVLFGSPGAGADHASELCVPPGHVWTARTPDDRIRYGEKVAVLDEDPMDEDFGARKVPLGPEQHGHHDYYEGDSAGLRNHARIVTGRYDEVK